jgi:hypothetical protein
VRKRNAISSLRRFAPKMARSKSRTIDNDIKKSAVKGCLNKRAS